MSTTLLPLGELSYNGVTFGPDIVTKEFTAKPYYDQAQRVVAYVVYTIRVSGKLSLATTALSTNLAPMDLFVDALQNLLLQPGGRLKYTQRGAGKFEINVGGMSDCVWGPKPRLYTYTPLGGGSAEFDWEVEVAIPRCGLLGQVQSFGLYVMEFNYRLQTDIDASGYTRRTYTGYLRVPQTRLDVADNTLHYTADQLRESVFLFLPKLFRRESQSYGLSEDKCRLDFSIVDVEMTTALPEGIISCRADHGISTNAKGWLRWTWTLSAEYEVAKNYGKYTAYNHFLALIVDRINKANQAPPVQIGKGSKSGFIPIGFTAREPDIFGRKVVQLSVSYLWITSLDSVIRYGGLWTKVKDLNGQEYSDDKWRASLSKSAINPRGTADLKFVLNSDALVSLCTNQQPLPRSEGNFANVLDFQTNFVIPCPGVDEVNSWIYYECSVEISVEDSIAIHTPLNPASKPTPPPQDALDGFMDKPPNEGNADGQGTFPGLPGIPAQFTNKPSGWQSMYSQPQAGQEHVFQHRGAPKFFISLVGEAYRAGFAIDCPVLLNVGGVPVLPANRDGVEFWDSRIVLNYGIPVVGAWWRQRWVLTKTPTQPIGIVATPFPGG